VWQSGPIPTVPSILVFCNLDDTLFEPRTFAADPSTHGAFDRTERERLPLVFCSSKTRAEVAFIHRQLGINQPFVCENGAAVFIPQGYFGVNLAEAQQVAGYEVIEFGKPYGEIVASVHHVVDRLDVNVVGFNDMSVEDVAIDCELPLLQARLAKLREYSEPIRFVDTGSDAMPKLLRALRAMDLGCVTRGRYHYVGAIRRGLGEQLLSGLYRRWFGGDVVTVAFGDHSSAVPLLRQVDVPLIVESGGSDETCRLLSNVPYAHVSTAESVGAWADLIFKIATAAQHHRKSLFS
jgi:mannosyl-3-phosphoglycerate phosphatase